MTPLLCRFGWHKWRTVGRVRWCVRCDLAQRLEAYSNRTMAWAALPPEEKP